MTQATETDLAMLRALAEEGRYAPLAGGRYLVGFGLLAACGNAGFWALGQWDGLTHSIMTFALIGFMILFGVAVSVFTNRRGEMARQETVLNKVESLVWSTSGIAMAVYVGIVTLRGVLGLDTPPILLGFIGVIAFLHYAVAFFVTAGLSRQTWLRIPAAGSLMAAVIVGLMADTPLVMPVSAGFVVLLAVVPGMLLMRAEKSA